MQTFRKKLREEVSGIVQDLVKTLEDGEESGKIRITSLMGKINERQKNIDMALDDFDARTKGIKEPAKKGFFK